MEDELSLRQPTALRWQINGLQVEGIAWGEAGETPVLALHGWLDNAASFAFLAPLLYGCHVVALDLTGHGLSDRRSPDASYQIWDDLPEVVGVLDALHWQHFDLLGHSRGAIIATLLASACPERVRRLVLLDAVAPQAVDEKDFPAQLRKALDDKPRLLTSDNRVYASVADAVTARKAKGLPAAAAAALAERNLGDYPDGGVTWVTDPRLHGASAVKLTQGQVNAVLQAVSMPTLVLLALDASQRFPELAALARRHINQLEIAEIEGGHHFHMEPGVTDVAQRILRFLGYQQGGSSV